MAFICCSCGSSKVAVLPVEDKTEEEINMGYGKIPASESTYAATRVDLKGNQITLYANIYDYLRGRVPGVLVTSDNQIIIRGLHSINLSNDPLYILDGSEIADISDINPMDVESIDVLKDSSSSIYGARGANGVIIITTKH